MNQNRSVATIDAPEFINLQPDAINPGISQCEIKVFYLGENRNHSYIDKNTAIQMANSLPGTPIVGAFRQDIEDFGDHGHIVHIENGEVHFSCKTVPYGFVAPDAQVWFKKFIDIDEFGEEIEREYLMTTGYLWTGQFPELESVVDEGKGQSMELDEQTMDGHWATNSKSGIEFFIINDAIFSKLCILGDDVEPCFEGAAVTSPEVSKNFAREVEFSQTLFTMINELKVALQSKGGSDMPNEEKTEFAAEEEAVEEVETEEGASDESEDTEEADFEKKDEDKEFAADDDKDEDTEDTDDTKDDESGNQNSDEEKDNKKKPASNNSLEFEELQREVEAMREELEVLRQFKLQQDDAKKMALINKYFMLSDEDKADIIAHKNEYSYDEIEAKLAVLYVQKNVDFTTIDGKNEEEAEVDAPTFTFSLDDTGSEFVPPIVEALRQTKRF